MSLTLRIEHGDGSESTLSILDADDLGDTNAPSIRTLSTTERVRRQPEQVDSAEVAVYRDAWTDVEPSIDRVDDKAFIEEDGTPIFAGRFDDWQYEGILVSVLVDSTKRDAVEAEPSGGNDVFDPQDDSSIVSTILGRVPTVAEGSVNTVTTGISFSESHASPGKSLEKLARDAGAELRWQPDFTLDYVDRIGTDRTTTLRPADGNIFGEPRIDERIRETITHIRVLGAGEGTAQISAERVSSSYSSGDRQKWAKFVDKEIQQQERADSLAEELLNEYDGDREYLELELELPRSVDPSVGDRFPIELPESNIDTTLRIMQLDRIIDEAGDRYRALFSNRDVSREQRGEQESRTVSEFAEGNAGQYYALSDGEGWDTVDDGEPYEFEFYRPPDTIGELRATLQLESRDYRLPAARDADSELYTNTGVDNFDNATDGQVVDFVNELDQDAAYPYLISASIGVDNDESVDFNQLLINAKDEDDGEVYFLSRSTGSSPSRPFGRQSGNRWISDDLSGKTVSLRISPGFTGGVSDADVTWSWSINAISPGVNTLTGETPSNVDVLVGPTNVASGLDHPIDESIDISGLLDDGRNDIKIFSDTLGEVRATIEYEGIKNAKR